MRTMLFSILFLLFSATVYAEVPERPSSNTYVYDKAGVIDDAAEEEMRAVIKQIEQETSNQIVLMTIDTIGDMEAFEFGQQVIRNWGVGQKDVDNGMLIFVTTGQGAGKNDIWISIGQGLGGDYPDGKLGRIIDEYMMESLKNGDFTAAFSAVLNVIKQEMLGEIENADPEAMEVEMGNFELILWLLVFLVIVVIVLWIIWTVIKIFIFMINDESGSSSGTSSSDDNYYDSGSNSSSDDSGNFGGGDSDGGGAGRNF
ncbi:MAG: TPM domain-containing protein [Solibacillus sp.]